MRHLIKGAFVYTICRFADSGDMSPTCTGCRSFRLRELLVSLSRCFYFLFYPIRS